MNRYNNGDDTLVSSPLLYRVYIVLFLSHVFIEMQNVCLYSYIDSFPKMFSFFIPTAIKLYSGFKKIEKSAYIGISLIKVPILFKK